MIDEFDSATPWQVLQVDSNSVSMRFTAPSEADFMMPLGMTFNT
jgi:hypothetical protein